jgi:hypothetical protein
MIFNAKRNIKIMLLLMFLDNSKMFFIFYVFVLTKNIYADAGRKKRHLALETGQFDYLCVSKLIHIIEIPMAKLIFYM